MLNQDEFDGLLNWLSPNRESAGEKYESIRAGLIRFFRYKGCGNDEELADETINRVARKLPDLDLNTGNKHITYFYGFASNIFLEEKKRRQKQAELDSNLPFKIMGADNDESESKFNCLEECLNKLEPNGKKLITGYYLKNKSEKFEHRRQLAESLNLSVNNLHVKAHRLRNALRRCLEECLKKKSL